jgi:hypothetical protein
MPLVEVLACPNCGAPLPVHGKTIIACLYCASVVRLRDHQPPIRVESDFTPDHMDKIKELALNGQRDAAIQEYQQATQSDLSEAEEIVDGVIKQIARQTLAKVTLNRWGWLTLVAYTLGFLVMLVLGVKGTIPFYVAIPLGLFALLNMAVLGRNALVALKYMQGIVAPATVLNYTHIGQMKMGRVLVHAVRVYLDVQPKNEPSMRVEMMLPVRDKSMVKLYPGTRMNVKYLPDDLNSFMFVNVIEDE